MALCAPYDKTGIDQVQAERLSMSWIERIKSNITPTRKASIPEGVWTKCDSCGQVLYRAELERNLEVCPKCDHHMRMSARNRLHSLLDEGSLVELGSELEPKDVLKFRDSKKYKDRLASAQKETGEKDALVVMKGTLYAMPVVAAAFEFSFMGGSMGSVVGARFVRAVEQALEDNCPLICFSASGGARMQEALMSLMQMAKTSAALAKMQERGLPYISVLTDPTMGGVSASFAMLGDLNIAEPKALIGFAGPRVIEQTVREKLPPGFQRSEFLIEKGAIDMIVRRPEMRLKLASILAKLMNLPAPLPFRKRLMKAWWCRRHRIRNLRPDKAEGRAWRRCPFLFIRVNRQFLRASWKKILFLRPRRPWLRGFLIWNICTVKPSTLGWRASARSPGRWISLNRRRSFLPLRAPMAKAPPAARWKPS